MPDPLPGHADLFPELPRPAAGREPRPAPTPPAGPAGPAWSRLRGRLWPCDDCYARAVADGRIRFVLPRGLWRRRSPDGTVRLLCDGHAAPVRLADHLTAYGPLPGGRAASPGRNPRPGRSGR